MQEVEVRFPILTLVSSLTRPSADGHPLPEGEGQG